MVSNNKFVNKKLPTQNRTNSYSSPCMFLSASKTTYTSIWKSWHTNMVGCKLQFNVVFAKREGRSHNPCIQTFNTKNWSNQFISSIPTSVLNAWSIKWVFLTSRCSKDTPLNNIAKQIVVRIQVSWYLTPSHQSWHSGFFRRCFLSLFYQIRGFWLA